MESKILLAFDFDHTIIDANSDLYVKVLAPDGEIPQEIEDQYSDSGWTEYMGEIFKYLHSIGIRENDMKKCMHEIEITEGMADLIKHAAEKGHEIIIISDSNSVFIDFILDNSNLKHAVLKVFTNPAQFDKNGQLQIEYYHTQDWCNRSTVNLCKGHILQEFIKERAKSGVTFSHVLYVGDGSNDLCPALTLRDQDFVYPRINFRLWKKLTNQKASAEQLREELKAQIVSWETGFDALKHLQELEKRMNC